MEFILDVPSKLNLKGDDYLLMKFDVSEEEFWEIANEDSNFELINGVLIIHSPASTEHEEIFGYLNFILRYYTEQTEKGKVFGSRLVMRLSETWNPEPDLMVILPEHYDRIKDTRIQGPADLVIEILSPTTRELDLTKKLPHFRQAGVGEIWIIDPKNQELTIYWEKEEKKWTKENADSYIESYIFPDLKFKPIWMWEREKYPSSKVIEDIFQR
ncbi:MAG: Uma2 family endonuclease [Promethearchaeota archaeon]